MAEQTILISDPKSIQRQISPAFYSENVFANISNPTFALEWLDKIGKDNIKHLAKLRIYVHPVYERGIFPPGDVFYNPQSGPPWCKLFRKLAADATGLRQIYIFWDSELTFGHSGGGADVDVVRALAEIRGLQKLEIDGYFAKEWPAYLQRKTGLTVWTPIGREDWYLRELRKFQRDTRDLAL
jgi:hypothetical protein